MAHITLFEINHSLLSIDVIDMIKNFKNIECSYDISLSLHQKSCSLRIFKPKEVLPPRQLSLRIRKLDPTGVPLPDVQEKEQQQSLSDQVCDLNIDYVAFWYQLFQKVPY